MSTTAAVVETEAKYSVANPTAMRAALLELGFTVQKEVSQRDEYYDLADESLSHLDYVIRVRRENGKIMFTFKGPRFFTATADYSRLEFQFSVNEEDLMTELQRHGLKQTWCLEKRTTDFRRGDEQVRVSLDEVPEIGSFAEIEGQLEHVREVAALVDPHLGQQETRNYQVLFLDHKERQGYSRDNIHGAAFGN